nr:PREDICTED: LOW QUALITY PROTEIN: fractalkine [Equus przewalskii]
MAPGSLSWLLSWATLCHLTMLLAGQQHGVKKCIFTCNKMTSEIRLHRLVRYQRNQESCDKPAIIFETKGHRNFCADPKERWVQEAMEHLDRQAAVTTQNGGTFEKQIGLSEPRTAPVTRGVDRSAVSEPKATEESSSQEAQRALGTSPELLMGAAGFWGTTSLSTSKPPDAGVPAGPKKTELLNTAAVTTATSWQSSAASQPESGLWAEGKSSEGPSTQAPSTQTPLVPDSQAATRRQAVGLLAFLGLLFCLGVAMFAYQSFQSCPHKLVGDVVERLHYIPRSCASNSYVLVPV